MYCCWYAGMLSWHAAMALHAGLSWKWGTGVITTMTILLMYSAAQDATRRHSHKAFWLSHQLFGARDIAKKEREENRRDCNCNAVFA
jgi:hypothetical protein